MNPKNITLGILVLAVLGVGVYSYVNPKSAVAPTSPSAESQEQPGKLKVQVFSGKLEKVNEGCYVDGECYVVVDGKHVTVIMGWSHETVGSVLGVESFGDLNSHIGDEVEVYAKDNADGTFTLYGSEGFYVKLK